MATVKIVTDSSCDLPHELIGDLPITVLPNRITLGDETYLDGVDLTAGEAHSRAHQFGLTPVVESPDLLTFTDTFAHLSRTAEGIISIHGSSRLGSTIEVANKARGYHYDRCQVVTVDSESASMGLGYIVLQAARAAEDGANVRDILDLVRTIVHQTHAVFVADAAEAAVLLGRPRPEPVAIGRGGTATAVAPVAAPTPLNGRPILKLEEGRIIALETVRNRTKALERLYEFVEIFPKVEDLCIVHGRTYGDVEWLLKRIDPIFPRKDVRVVPYGPALARHVGHAAVGVVAYEGLAEDDEED